MKKSNLKAMVEIDKLNEHAKSIGKSFFTIKQSEYVAGQYYRVNKLFCFIERYLETYENAKIISMTNIYGDHNKIVSVPVYEEAKVIVDNRYYICGKKVLVD